MDEVLFDKEIKAMVFRKAICKLKTELDIEKEKVQKDHSNSEYALVSISTKDVFGNKPWDFKVLSDTVPSWFIPKKEAALMQNIANKWIKGHVFTNRKAITVGGSKSTYDYFYIKDCDIVNIKGHKVGACVVGNSQVNISGIENAVDCFGKCTISENYMDHCILQNNAKPLMDDPPQIHKHRGMSL
ncbi:MAG TPA: hypothetical protein VHO66_08130 [Ruminiclostridium sp.]|nr:hypothetical protein [Ruminiclostridium sp.]